MRSANSATRAGSGPVRVATVRKTSISGMGLSQSSSGRDRKTGPDGAAMQSLIAGSFLHDVGKIGIPDAILLKPGKLTVEEFEVMKTHTTLGFEALVRAEEALGERLDFLAFAKQIALSHQEKWDGSGYPHGLAGDNIPVAARLMALADVYDALISQRVYKPPFDHTEAVRIITLGRGSHFDPDLVDTFLRVQYEFRAIAERYVDTEDEVMAKAALLS